MIKKYVSILAALLALNLTVLPLTSCEKEVEEKVTTEVADVQEQPEALSPWEAYTIAYNAYVLDTENYVITHQYSIVLSEKNAMVPTIDAAQNIVEHRDGESVYAQIKSGGETLESTYVDGVMYSVVQNSLESVKAKATMTWEEYVKQMGYTKPAVLLRLTEDCFQYAKYIVEDGEEILEIKLNSEQMRSAVNLRDYLSLGAISDSAQFPKVVYKVYFDENGKVEKVRVEMKLTVVYQQKVLQGNAYVTTTISYDNAQITPPQNSSSYIDITGQLGAQ